MLSFILNFDIPIRLTFKGSTIISHTVKKDI